MFSVRSLLTVWVSLSAAILGYAYLDLTLTPGLHQERGFSIHVDIERISELWHWGGRLLNEGAIGLLIFNAIAVGGLLSLASLWLVQSARKLLDSWHNDRSERAETTVTTTVAFGSIPPPANH